MTIGEIVRQGLYYARTCRSLWVFGFFVGLASGGSNGGGGRPGHGSGSAWDVDLLNLSGIQIAAIAGLVLAAIVAVTVLRFIGEGALIEGVVRARRGDALSTREAFRAGWAHWGVLLRIALLYLGATVGSLALLAVPCVLAARAFGPIGGVVAALPTLVLAVPWLVTLYLLQAFAARIAVLEQRRALDAIGKARLFLHGRLGHGLKLLVATFAGTLIIGLLAAAVLAPLALGLVALAWRLEAVPVIVIGALVLLPAVYVLMAVLGTYRSSVWTIGYVTQVES